MLRSCTRERLRRHLDQLARHHRRRLCDGGAVPPAPQTGRATPGRVWVQGCECREVVIDWAARTIYHPFLACQHYAHETPLDIEDTEPL